MVPNTVETLVNGAIVGGSPAVTALVVDDATGFAVGNNIMIINDEEGDFVVRKITNISTNTITVDRALTDIKDNAVVKKVHDIGIGSKEDQPYFSAKIAGKLANGDEVVILIPKIRVVRGFNLAFTTDDFANLPLEFTVYDLVSTDIFYADFGGDQAKMYKA